MSRISVLSAPFLLGFDAFEERIDRMTKAADSYPPYNIERLPTQSGDENYLIMIAVAGFSAPELDLTVEDNQIIARGQKSSDPERDFLHRGIATRQFQRSFLLADGMSVDGAELRDGMLRISVHRPEPKSRSERIEIKTA